VEKAPAVTVGRSDRMKGLSGRVARSKSWEKRLWGPGAVQISMQRKGRSCTQMVLSPREGGRFKQYFTLFSPNDLILGDLCRRKEVSQKREHSEEGQLIIINRSKTGWRDAFCWGDREISKRN